jgi:hypothetical protein
MDNNERRSPNLSLSVFRIPRYKYYPTHLMDECGPEQWERLKILQACERLDIPDKLWPKIPMPQLPRGFSVRSYLPIKEKRLLELDFPPFSWLEDSISEWKKECHKCFDKYLQEYADKFEAKFQDAIRQGVYTKIPQSREVTPSNLRYEWAAQRYCYRTPYKELASKGYTQERVKQAVLQILKTAGLKNGK